MRGFCIFPVAQVFSGTVVVVVLAEDRRCSTAFIVASATVSSVMGMVMSRRFY